MAKIVKNNVIIDDSWILVEASDQVTFDQLPDGDLILPYRLWKDNRTGTPDRSGFIAVWLDSDEPPQLIADSLQQLPLVAINFPVFTDGRGYSYARLLRERYGFQGEIRAIGDVSQDQLFFLKRCGFDSFAVRADKDIEEAIRGMQPFADNYQAACDQQLPYFRRR